MSAENVQLVRRIYDAWAREESARDFISADVEYVNPSYAVEPGTRRGRASFRLVRDTYEDFRLAIERYIDAGGDDVLDVLGVLVQHQPLTWTCSCRSWPTSAWATPWRRRRC